MMSTATTYGKSRQEREGPLCMVSEQPTSEDSTVLRITASSLDTTKTQEISTTKASLRKEDPGSRTTKS